MARSLFLKKVNDVFTAHNKQIRINVNGKNLEIYFTAEDTAVEDIIDAIYAEAIEH
jgi:hypothetical protein